MDFDLSDEEAALIDGLRGRLKRACSTERLRSWESASVSVDDGFVGALVEGGFFEAGLPFGDCPSFSALALLEEEAGRFLAPPLLGWLSGYAAFLLADHPLARRIVAGEIVSPFVPGACRLMLEDGRVSGSGEGVQFLDRAHLLVGVAEGADGPTVVVVERDAARLAAQAVAMQSGIPRWRVTLDRAIAAEVVPISEERRSLAEDRLRTCVAAWSVGAGAQALDLAIAYAREREQFGHPIGSYQSVQNRLVDAAIQVEEARMLVYRAAALIDASSSAEDDAGSALARPGRARQAVPLRGLADAQEVSALADTGSRPEGRTIGSLPDIQELSSLARHLAGGAFAQASRAALATFGGYGFTVDFDIQLYFRRAKEVQLGFEPRTRWHEGADVVPGFRDPTDGR